MVPTYETSMHWSSGSAYHSQLLPSLEVPTKWLPISRAWEINRFIRDNPRIQLRMAIRKGEGLLLGLGEEFLRKNSGNYVAISYASGKAMATAETLDKLNKELMENKVEEDCYVARIGYRGIATIP